MKCLELMPYFLMCTYRGFQQKRAQPLGEAEHAPAVVVDSRSIAHHSASPVFSQKDSGSTLCVLNWMHIPNYCICYQKWFYKCY